MAEVATSSLDSRLLVSLRAALAIVLAAATLLYAVVWSAVNQAPLPAVELGFDEAYLPSENVRLVTVVRRDGPAERAGLRRGDRIQAINGNRTLHPYSMFA